MYRWAPARVKRPAQEHLTGAVAPPSQQAGRHRHPRARGATPPPRPPAAPRWPCWRCAPPAASPARARGEEALQAAALREVRVDDGGEAQQPEAGAQVKLLHWPYSSGSPPARMVSVRAAAPALVPQMTRRVLQVSIAREGAPSCSSGAPGRRHQGREAVGGCGSSASGSLACTPG
jgi:hypothetical protein